MPRRAEGTWVSARSRYVASLGPRYRDASGRWRRRQVDLEYEDGTPVRWGDESGRLAALARLKAACEAEDEGASTLTVAALAKRWLDWHEETGSAPTTVKTNRNRIKRAINLEWRGGFMGDVPAESFDAEHLLGPKGVRAQLRKAGLTDSGIQPIDQAVRTMFRWAHQFVEGRDPLQLVRANPFAKGSVKTLPVPKSDRPCPTWDDLLAILDRMDAAIEADEHWAHHRGIARQTALAVRVLAERGARPREVETLRIEDWSEGDGSDRRPGFKLSRHKTMKRGVVGVIPVRGDTIERVREIIEARDRKGPWVWWPDQPAGEVPSEGRLGNWWRANRVRFGAKDYTLYGFRNTISNHLRMAGVEGRSMQLALRQTPEIADSVYRRDTLAEAAGVFDAAGLG